MNNKKTLEQEQKSKLQPFPFIDKAKETEEYKKAWEKERELSKKFSDMMDIGEQE